MRFVTIHMGADTYLDHLGVLSILLDIPMIVTDPETFHVAQRFYPKLKCVLKDPLDLSLPFLANHYDVILMSGRFLADEMIPLFDLLFRKKMRMIYCPHGNSDKGYSLQDTPSQDISLVYGQHMIDLLQKIGALEKISSYVVTGNFRAHFYLENKSYYDSITHQLLGPHIDKNKKTLLYAPTFSDKENTSSFFSKCEKIIEGLHPNFNLVIKLHPGLEEQALAHTHYVREKYKKIENVVFLSSFPMIYPLLNFCDGYLGDFSSIGYDMLFFKKPMFFFGSNAGIIYRCGQEVPADGDILSFILENWDWNVTHFVSIRKEIYSYTFGRKQSGKEMLRKIKRALLNRRALDREN
ncbi:MAG: CDP-glycerol glycerophosphotransferase family protein [Rhabdochlamydiaceae bacterium]|jgi:hypothetical protein